LKRVEDSNKHIIEEIVRQVGHLSELYEDAQSEKYKTCSSIPMKCHQEKYRFPQEREDSGNVLHYCNRRKWIL
jgi:hypothetical protein